MSGTPEWKNMRAVIVGIDVYDCPDDDLGVKNVAGPVNGALAFYDRLAEKIPNPEQNIKLFLAPIPSYEPHYWKSPSLYNYEQATAWAIGDYFQTEIAAGKSEGIIVYWCGHGIIEDFNDPDRVNKHFLFTRDCANETLSGLYAEELIHYLRNTTVQGGYWWQSFLDTFPR